MNFKNFWFSKTCSFIFRGLYVLVQVGCGRGTEHKKAHSIVAVPLNKTLLHVKYLL